jgi:predicted RNase H-like HicB family nuclease
MTRKAEGTQTKGQHRDGGRGSKAEDRPVGEVEKQLADLQRRIALLRRSLKRREVVKINVVLHPDPTGGYSVEVPALPGCYSEGDTEEEALANIREAIECCLSIGTRHLDIPPGHLVRQLDLGKL